MVGLPVGKESVVAASVKPGKSTGQFVRQGHTTDGTYGSDPNPKYIDSTDKPVRDLKP